MTAAHGTVTVTNANESCILKMVKVANFIIYIYIYVTEIFKRKRLNYLPKSHGEKVAEVRGKATSV